MVLEVPVRRLDKRLLSGRWDCSATAAFGSGRACCLTCRMYWLSKVPSRVNEGMTDLVQEFITSNRKSLHGSGTVRYCMLGGI